jgi:phosphatidylserine/phosphatidylglycerophosphate/cardiolipin synthase-like enzyme
MDEALLTLPASDLRALAASLRTGRLDAPYSASSLGRFVAEPLAPWVAASLQYMADAGMQPSAAAHTLELLASAVSGHSPVEDLVDLVMTGPPVAGQENRDTSVVVSDLFRQAEETILIAGYAVYQGRKVFHALAQRMVERPALRTRMFLDIQRKLGDTSSSAELVRRFAHRFQSDEWPMGSPTPEVFYDPRALSSDRVKRAALHAKCVVADGREVFVSSANFTEAAQERNIEIGLLLHSTAIAGRVTRFFDALCASGQFQRAL